MKNLDQYREKKDALLEEYKALPDIRLNIDDNYVPKHLDDKAFIEWLINVGVAVHNTLDMNGEVQCVPFRNRSMPDLYKLIQHYRKIELEPLIFDMLQLTREGRLQTFYCGQILRRVWFSVHYKHGYKDDLRKLERHTGVLLDKGIKNCIPLTELLDYEQLVKNPRKTRREAESRESMWGTFETFTLDTGTRIRMDDAPEPVTRVVGEGGVRFVNPFEDAPTTMRMMRRENETIEEFRERMRYIAGEAVILQGTSREMTMMFTPERMNRAREIGDTVLNGIVIVRNEFESRLEFIRRVNFILGRNHLDVTNTLSVIHWRYATPDVVKRAEMDYNDQHDGVHPPSRIRISRMRNQSNESLASAINYIDGGNRTVLNHEGFALTMRTTERMTRYNTIKRLIAEHVEAHGMLDLPVFTPEYIDLHSIF